MPAHKRTRTGQIKPQNPPAPPTSDIVMTDVTPPCAQPPPPPSPKSTETSTQHPSVPSLAPKPMSPNMPRPKTRPTNKPAEVHHKMAKLPPNTHITKRPLLHPAIPTPFAAAVAPKIIYITASSPYIPCLKRVRRLLGEIDRRAKQALAAKSRGASEGARGGGRRGNAGHAEANGKLDAGAVERDIAQGVRATEAGPSVAAEQVFLKATGRAIARALEVGVYFQGEGGYKVRVDMGSVKAVDDIESTSSGAMPVGQRDDQVPETRIRTLSSVTVGIGRM